MTPIVSHPYKSSKINFSTLKVGDTIEVDCGYCGIIDMETVTIVSIGYASDLWDAALSVPHVVVKTASGETFSVRPDIFS